METIIKSSLIFTFCLSIFFKLLNYLSFYKLYKAAGDMSGARLDIIRQIKRRFSDCISLGKPIENTESYVRRILLSSEKYNTAGSSREKISTCLLLVFWGILWFGYTNGFFSYENTILCTLISMVLVYVTDRIFDTIAMESCFITLASDYLDNTLKARLAKSGTERMKEKRTAGTASHAMQAAAGTFTKVKNSADDKALPELAAADESELISSIINEFIL